MAAFGRSAPSATGRGIWILECMFMRCMSQGQRLSLGASQGFSCLRQSLLLIAVGGVLLPAGAWAQEETLTVDGESNVPQAVEGSGPDTPESLVVEESEAEKAEAAEVQRRTAGDKEITDAIERLKAESAFLGDYQGREDRKVELEGKEDESGVFRHEQKRLQEDRVMPVFKRPHPLVQQIKPEQTLRLLQRMTYNITGHRYQDVYIRWHLLWAVKEHMPESDRRQAGQHLVKLLQRLPEPISAERRQEYYREPYEHWLQWERIYPHPHEFRALKGYPPFRETIHPPESFKYLGPDKKAEYERRLVEAEEYRKLHPFKTIRDEDAILFNRRVYDLRFAYRQYIGELVYETLRTGDPRMLDVVMGAIEKLVNQKDGRSYDLLAYMYLAAFDGELEQFPQDALLRTSRQLESLARRNERYENYHGQVRNFADYSFHMVHMLKDMYGASGEASEEMLLSVEE